MAFLVAAGLLPSQVDVHVLLAFMEYLCQNNFTPSNISNYLARIRAYCVIYNIPTTSFRDEMFIRSLKINKPLLIKNTSILTDAMIVDILEVTAQLETPQAFTALYLLAFFSFLRLSTMVPHSFRSFDISRHLARSDIIFSHDMAIILVKWSKTIQSRDKIAHIHIPVLSESRLCPFTALKCMLAIVPGSQDDPLSSICRQGRWVPLTDSIVRKHLQCITHILRWEHMHITFHTFRRSWALFLGSWAFQHGVPIDAIKQAAWNSDCVWHIFIHILKLFLILSYKLLDYTYPIDGCLGECFSVLLSCLLLLFSLVPGLPVATFMVYTLAALRARAPCPSVVQV